MPALVVRCLARRTLRLLLLPAHASQGRFGYFDLLRYMHTYGQRGN